MLRNPRWLFYFSLSLFLALMSVLSTEKFPIMSGVFLGLSMLQRPKKKKKVETGEQ